MQDLDVNHPFVKRVDRLILNAIKTNDIELLSGLSWLDEKAFEDGISIYMMIAIVLSKKNMECSVKSWVAERVIK